MNEIPCQLLDHLRQETRKDHHALDEHPRLNRLLRPGLDLTIYTDALLGLYPAQHSLEGAAVAAIEHLHLDYPLSQRAGHLREDLTRLGLTLPEDFFTHMKAPRDRGELVGLLYVLEGSRLGARLLADRIRALLGVETPLRFFGGAAGAEIWPAFRRFVQLDLANAPEDEYERTAAAGMARQAFAKFSQSLDTPRPINTLGNPCTQRSECLHAQHPLQ